ncbi:unnamed protein product [Urochloa humidicola]
MSLSGGSSCKWYINPKVPEAKELMASAKTVHMPVAWAESKGIPSAPRAAAEEKKISDIKNLNPFECKKTEFLVTVIVKKIDGKSWWYNACKQCSHTAKRHGNSFKCINTQCGSIGMAAPRITDIVYDALSSLASSATPTKAICAAEQQQTPQSVNKNASDEHNTLPSTEDALGYSATKTQISTTKKRPRPSPDKKLAKKLFPAEEARDGDGDSDGGADAADQISPIKEA